MQALGAEVNPGLFSIPSRCSGIPAATNCCTAHLETKSVPRAHRKVGGVQRCGSAALEGKGQSPLEGKTQALLFLLRLKVAKQLESSPQLPAQENQCKLELTHLPSPVLFAPLCKLCIKGKKCIPWSKMILGVTLSCSKVNYYRNNHRSSCDRGTCRIPPFPHGIQRDSWLFLQQRQKNTLFLENH